MAILQSFVPNLGEIKIASSAILAVEKSELKVKTGIFVKIWR